MRSSLSFEVVRGPGCRAFLRLENILCESNLFVKDTVLMTESESCISIGFPFRGHPSAKFFSYPLEETDG